MGERNKDISEELENAEVLDFGKKDFNAYSKLQENIEKGFTKASDAYVLIACSLWQIYHNEYYRIDNYKTIADFALEKYELKKSSTHNYIKVAEKFGNIVNGKITGLKEEFKFFKCSQLINMLTFTPEQIEKVQPDWTVKQIIELGKYPLGIVKNDDSVLEPENANVPDSSNDTDGFSEFMYTPEIVSGRTTLMESDDFEEILKNREALLSAFNDMKRDKNFQNKKIRFVIELAYD